MELAGRRHPTGADGKIDGGRARAVGAPEGIGRPKQGSVRLPAELESVAVGRRWVREKLVDGHGIGEPAVGDVLQALSEALTNAVLHGDGLHVELEYSVNGGAVKVSVVNGVRDGAEPRRRGPVGPDAESGRGFDLVEAFSDQWGIARTSSGQVKVWFEVTAR